MKPEDRIHRSPVRGAPGSTVDRPPLLLRHLGKGARVRLVCGACTWSKSYDPRRLIARLQEKAAGGEATAIAHVARHVQWPCPACRRMAWVTQPDA
jgi:hypothetical protein